MRRTTERDAAAASGVSGRSARVAVASASGVAAVGGMLFGYDTGVIAGALLFISDEFSTGELMEQLIVSGLLLGALVGAWQAGRLTDRFGRRRVLLVTALLYLGGVLLAALAPAAWVLVAARVVLGLAVGSSSMVVPLYIAELAPPAVRGRLVTLNQLMITVGILVAGLVDYALADAEAWRWMLGLAGVPSIVLFIGVLPQPESPAWLVEHGQAARARGVLRRLRQPGHDTDGEIAEIQEVHERTARRSSVSLLAPALRPALLLGVALAVIQQVTGINTVIYYAPTILADAGLATNSSILATVLVGTVNIVFTLISIWLIDRLGRRPLLLFSVGGMIVGLLALAALFAAAGGDLTATQGVLAIAALMFYVACFAIGLGPVFWLLLSELYPLEVRGRAMAVGTAANWGANFLVALTFLTVARLLTTGGAFALYAGISMVSLGYLLARAPETKGRSLAQIEAALRSREPRDRPGGPAVP